MGNDDLTFGVNTLRNKQSSLPIITLLSGLNWGQGGPYLVA